MPFVDRDANQVIVAAYDTSQWDGQEWVEEFEPEWARFCSERWEEKIRRLKRELAIVDRMLSQALIDLLNILRVSYGLNEAELPESLMRQIAFKQRLKQELEIVVKPVAVAH